MLLSAASDADEHCVQTGILPMAVETSDALFAAAVAEAAALVSLVAALDAAVWTVATLDEATVADCAALDSDVLAAFAEDAAADTESPIDCAD